MTPEISLSPEFVKEKPINQVFENFLSSQEFAVRAKAPNSKLAYATDLQQFRDFCCQQRIGEITQLKSSTIDGWINQMRTSGYSESSVQRKIASLRGFLNWIVIQRLILPDLTQNLPRLKKTPERPLLMLTEEQVKALISETQKLESSRDTVLVLIGLTTGARASEIVALDVKDVIKTKNAQVKAVRFTGLRQSHPRIVPVDSQTGKTIGNYLFEEDLKAGKPLFSNQRPQQFGTKRLTRHGYYFILKEYGGKIGVPDLTPTLLRNTFAANFKGTEEELTKILGITRWPLHRLYHRTDKTQN